ncbi:thiamine-phosphate pyrophosphorylase [Ancylobacter novellus DSM 506]|uniref:Thiamine-phosphate synthase n=1 Tax=Ancylobacter novellus (strain ATCC 8093 / DSM 506 / JCM 20403 / CCM 1077 / IAM 12100 / NBRC 12443 / NCIMB 10456) TaxID=639283 RepID=D7A4N2_ANCN5|nr:thiamine phosphate synthase [Ancylobacter novellus]ADH89895.1 thiamine-phosphate pyrophosphorylase [Ancylobacter novellus DSM 506]
MKLDPFYLIVDRASWLPRLLPQGVKLVQLRAKDKEEAELRREIAEARAVCERYGAQLVVNDHWRLAIEEGCDFVHLGQEDLAAADLTAIRSAGLKLGISTHDEAELEVALLARPDYVALGPVYPTILKKMRWAPQGLERVAKWKKRVGDLPLVGIGGLTIDRAQGVLEAGADSLAVVTDVLLNDNPERRAREWVLATREMA